MMGFGPALSPPTVGGYFGNFGFDQGRYKMLNKRKTHRTNSRPIIYYLGMLTLQVTHYYFVAAKMPTHVADRQLCCR